MKKAEKINTRGANVPPTEYSNVQSTKASLQKPLFFVGRQSLSKLYLVLHFGRMLSGMGKVGFVTVNPDAQEETIYDYCGIEVRELPLARFVISEAGSFCHSDEDNACFTPGTEGKSSPGLQEGRLKTSDSLSPHNKDYEKNRSGNECFRIVNLPDSTGVPDNSNVLMVTDPDRNSLEEGILSIRELAKLSSKFILHRIYLDVCDNTRVDVRYLEAKIFKELPVNAILGSWYALMHDEKNMGAIYDNQHDDTLRLLPLSSSYHKLLASLAYSIYGIPIKQCYKLIRSSDKRH